MIFVYILIGFSSAALTIALFLSTQPLLGLGLAPFIASGMVALAAAGKAYWHLGKQIRSAKQNSDGNVGRATAGAPVVGDQDAGVSTQDQIRRYDNVQVAPGAGGSLSRIASLNPMNWRVMGRQGGPSFRSRERDSETDDRRAGEVAFALRKVLDEIAQEREGLERRLEAATWPAAAVAGAQASFGAERDVSDELQLREAESQMRNAAAARIDTLKEETARFSRMLDALPEADL